MTSPLLHPVGSEPATVYWRRRLVLLLAVAALVVLVVSLTGRGGRAGAVAGGGPVTGGSAPAAGAATATPAADPTASEPPTDPADAPACEDGQLEVAVSTGAASYGVDAAPRFTLEATNTGDSSCSVDLALGDQVELLLVSGDDRVWSSGDCQDETGERVVTLQPGDADKQSMSWQRVRSDEGCPDDLPEPGAGSYEVTARVGAATSEPATFTLD